MIKESGSSLGILGSHHFAYSAVNTFEELHPGIAIGWRERLSVCKPMEGVGKGSRDRIYRQVPDTAEGGSLVDHIASCNKVANEVSASRTNIAACYVSAGISTVAVGMGVEMATKDENLAIISGALWGSPIGLYINKWIEKPMRKVVDAFRMRSQEANTKRFLDSEFGPEV